MAKDIQEFADEIMSWTDKQRGIFMRMGGIVQAINGMPMADLVQMESEISRDEAIGPLMDPTKWRDENKFEQASQMKRVVRATLAFKKEVSGIGRFHNVNQTAVEPS